ncbi:hypothetical protein HYG93_11030 [Acinetobacter sp. SwsAc6]|uniref:hypothetical protein n=1 Tax=Acinetobacter TaxID=469 RepID=UPI0015B9918D|nr:MULTISPECIES: hypothetical protein [Acinetobacter]NWK74801.1 hypothetical protein [Acinetobacter sp. SwsAc6]
MPNYQLDNQIKIINMLELFIFEKIRSTPFLGSHKSILMASNEEDLRKAIYALHDKGLFQESKENKIKRLCNKPVKAYFSDKNGNDEVEKLDFEYLPKHYDEIIQKIRNYRSFIKDNKHDAAEVIYNKLLRNYAQHFDSYIPETLPEPLQKTINARKKNYLSQIPRQMKEEAYIHFVSNFIKKYENKHEKLWDDLNFSFDDKRLLKELSSLQKKNIDELTNNFKLRKYKSEIKKYTPRIKFLLEQIIDHVNNLAESEIRELTIQNYKYKESKLKEQINRVNSLLSQRFLKQTSLIKQKIYKTSSSKKLSPIKQINRLSSLLDPKISIHDRKALAELKKLLDTANNKYVNKIKGSQIESKKINEYSYVGDTERILRENKELYQGLKNLLKSSHSSE